MTHRRPPRLPTFSYTGRYHYFVTCCTEHRRRLFTSCDRVDCVRSQILRTASERDFAVPAGVFMPDHVHLLLQGLSDTADFRRAMTVIRQRAAVSFAARFGERLWQTGYYERVLRNLHDVPDVVEYIVGNRRQAGVEPARDDRCYLWTPDAGEAGC